MNAALECYLNSILEIAETIEAISPDIASPFREPLVSLRSRLGSNPTPEDLVQSRDTLHEILRQFSQRARLYNQTLANDLNQTLGLVARTEDSSAGRNVQYVERLVDFVDRLESGVRCVDVARLASVAVELREFAQSIELDSRDDFARLRQ